MADATSQQVMRMRGSTKKASRRVSTTTESRNISRVAETGRVSKLKSQPQKQRAIGRTEAITRSQTKLELEWINGHDTPANHNQVTTTSLPSQTFTIKFFLKKKLVVTRTLTRDVQVHHQTQIQSGDSFQNTVTQLVGAQEAQNNILSASATATATVQSLSNPPAQSLPNSFQSRGTLFSSTSAFETSTVQCDDTLVPCGDALVLCGDALVPCGDALVPCGDALVPCGDTSVPCGDASVLCGDASVLCGDASVLCGDTSVQSKVTLEYGPPPAQYIDGRNKPPVNPAQGISILASSTLLSQDIATFSQSAISFSASSTALFQAPSASISVFGTSSAQYIDAPAQPTIDQAERISTPAQPTIDQAERISTPPSSTSPAQHKSTPAQSPVGPPPPTTDSHETNFCDLPEHCTLAQYQGNCILSGESESEISELRPGQPPAWATSRTNLADATRWFRVVQGSTQHNNGNCHGVFLGKHGGIRPYMDDEIVITRTGGGYKPSSSGRLVLNGKQPKHKSPAKDLIKNMEQDKAVGLIISRDNDQLQVELPANHNFNIMAFFRITDVWYEMIDNNPGLKVRFEKVDLSLKSWWAPKGTPPPPTDAERDWEIKPDHFVCPSCRKQSDIIFTDGKICLNADCKRFWFLGNERANGNVTYHPKFLKKRTKAASVKCPFPLVPDLIKTLNNGQATGSTYRDNWKGVVCPVCRKCLSRTYWKGWKCDGEGCTWQYLADLDPVSLGSVVGPEMPNSQEHHAVVGGSYGDMVSRSVDPTSTPYCKVTYSIPGVGSVFHYGSRPAINARPGGPNDLFGALQTDDIDLRRYPLQSSVVAGTLTAHFAVNYGMPYKYVVKVASKGFNEASDAVRRSLGRLTWATQDAITSVGESYHAPNELLLLAYFQGMKIGYHDDGESTLGPTIATLSLGAGSVMKIRMKDQYYKGGRTENSLLDDDPVLPGCFNEEQRRRWKQQLNAGKIDQVQYDNLRKQAFKVGGGEAAPAIIMTLCHGDLVVMDRSALQKYYEHSVIPQDRLRFALTARFVKDNGFTEAERRKGQFTLSPAETYHGD